MFENGFLACGPINKFMTMLIHQKLKSNMYKSLTNGWKKHYRFNIQAWVYEVESDIMYTKLHTSVVGTVDDSTYWQSQRDTEFSSRGTTTS